MFSSFLVSNNPLSRESLYEPQALEYRINLKINSPYAGSAGMLPHINGKFTMGNLFLRHQVWKICDRTIFKTIAVSLYSFEFGCVIWFSKHELCKECSFERGSENSIERMWCRPNGFCINGRRSFRENGDTGVGLWRDVLFNTSKMTELEMFA